MSGDSEPGALPAPSLRGRRGPKGNLGPVSGSGIKIAVVGSREYPELERVRTWIDKLAEKHPHATVVSGGARGVDRVAERRAHERGLLVKSFRVHDNRVWFVVWRPGETEDEPNELVIGVPTFHNFAAAAYWRNGEIVRFATHVVVFHDGVSKGTADTIRKAERADKLRAVYSPQGTQRPSKKVGKGRSRPDSGERLASLSEASSGELAFLAEVRRFVDETPGAQFDAGARTRKLRPERHRSAEVA